MNSVDLKRRKIVVVCGGISTEMEISINSGEAIYHALLDYGYQDVSIFYLTEYNLHLLIEQKPDVVYIALHGKGGEDGTIQGALELAGIKYTGPGVASSAICMDKVLTKFILSANGVPTAKYEVFQKDDYDSIEAVAGAIKDKIGLPLVVKAPNQGSSIGVHIVKDEKDLICAVRDVFLFGNTLLAEEFIDGIELTLPIIGNGDLTVLPEIEIVSECEFYDFQSKYTKGMSHHIIPARISDEMREKLRAIGEKTYKLLGCRGISRIDFLVDPSKGPLVMEVNTSPGMTSTSLFPDAAQKAGISFGELLVKVMGYALE